MRFVRTPVLFGQDARNIQTNGARSLSVALKVQSTTIKTDTDRAAGW